MVPKALEVLFFFSVFPYLSVGYKFLAVYPVPMKSHSLLGEAVVRNLLAAGHEITYITAYEYKNPPPNLRQIDISDNKYDISGDIMNLKNFVENKNNLKNFLDIKILKIVMGMIAESTLSHKSVQNFFQDENEHFDAVIAEYTHTEHFSGLAALYECPMIWTYPLEANWMSISLVDKAPNPAYSSDVLSIEAPPFTFTRRLKELWSRIKVAVIGFVYCNRAETNVYNEYIVPHIEKRGRKAPSYSEVRHNASLVLGNSHVSIGEAQTLPENYKQILGYHIEENVKPLPQNLQKIMDNSKNGVIYFSMGSGLAGKDWPEYIKRDLLKLFGELKQTVLWKFEEDIPHKPKNVHLLQWAPQQSILAHKNCALFITHGGISSTTEAVHFGVPIIGIPIFFDQFLNVERAVNKGFAVSLNLSPNIAADLKVAINESLSNTKYREKVKELSLIYHHRVISPAAELLHWVEHVVKTKGAHHLRSSTHLIPFYQIMYLDAILFFVTIGCIFIEIRKRLCPFLCSKQRNLLKNKKSLNGKPFKKIN